MSGKNLIDRHLIVILFFSVGQVFFHSCHNNENSKENLELIVSYNLDSTNVATVGYVNDYGKQGEWYFFDDLGRLELVETYKNNIVHGKVEMYICCRKFQEYIAENGKIIGRVTNYSPNGDIVSISYYDSTQVSFSLNLFNSKIYEINSFDKNRKINLVYSDSSVLNVKEQFPVSYGCCIDD